MDGCQVGKTTEEIKSLRFIVEGNVNDAAYDAFKSSLSATNGIFEVDMDKNSKEMYIDYYPDKISKERIENRFSDWTGKLS